MNFPERITKKELRTINGMCPTNKLKHQLQSLIDLKHENRLNKFFKRHGNEIEKCLHDRGFEMTLGEAKEFCIKLMEDAA